MGGNRVNQDLKYIIRVVLCMKTSRLVLAVIIPAILLCGCGRSDSKFNSKEWKKGGSSSRGAMVQDLIEHDLLRDKSASEVRELLGKPDDCTTGLEPARTECDDAKVYWYGYRVVTIFAMLFLGMRNGRNFRSRFTSCKRCDCERLNRPISMECSSTPGKSRNRTSGFGRS